mmetsp:Transcript_28602/g.48575  ORF Transcript_28602/g.48575 Transcript_28602/m.48575 type:complete len:254 (-) Transcript_28602:1187-1948(-)
MSGVLACRAHSPQRRPIPISHYSSQLLVVHGDSSPNIDTSLKSASHYILLLLLLLLLAFVPAFRLREERIIVLEEQLPSLLLRVIFPWRSFRQAAHAHKLILSLIAELKRHVLDGSLMRDQQDVCLIFMGEEADVLDGVVCAVKELLLFLRVNSRPLVELYLPQIPLGTYIVLEPFEEVLVRVDGDLKHIRVELQSSARDLKVFRFHVLSYPHVNVNLQIKMLCDFDGRLNGSSKRRSNDVRNAFTFKSLSQL